MIDHIDIIMQHNHLLTVTGQLIRLSLEYLALESGLKGEPMGTDVDYARWITKNTWIGKTLKSMRKQELSMNKTMQALQYWSTHDEMIMEDIK